jgi:hypothetical protein
MFSAPVESTENTHYEYRVLADGQERVNVWEWGMMADGADMSVPEFVAEYGLEFFVSLAREDYRRWLADQGEATALSPLTISPLPTSPFIPFNATPTKAGGPAAPALSSSISEAALAFAVLAEVAQEHGEKIAGIVKRLLSQHGVIPPDLVYSDIKKRLRKGLAISRFEEGWEVFLAGGVQWPDGYGQPFTVASRSQPGEEHRVYLAVAPGHRRQYQCECRDHYGHADKLAGGFCAHILAALVAFLAGMMLVEERKQDKAGQEAIAGEEAA